MTITRFLWLSAILIIITFVLWGESLEHSFEIWLSRNRDEPGMFSFVSFLVLVSDIFLPVPSSVVMFLNGNVLGFYKGFALSLSSCMIGSLVGYYFGKLFNPDLSSSSNQKAKKIIHRYGDYIVLITRGIPIISESVCVVSGYARVPAPRFFALSFLGYLPVCALYAWFGNLSQDKNVFLISFLISVLFAGILMLAGRGLNRKEQSDRS
ncbi:MAG: hypothetical protein GC181_04070 [Bacteroidetes bacterium]|nr:hypothetical protein [Bacteroidota bacterium]